MEAMDVQADKQSELIALCTIMLSLASTAVALRCWSIYVSPKHRLGFDDIFAILTLPFIIAEFALIYWWISLGLGRHASTLPPQDVLQGPKIIFAAAFLYDASISLPKFSALFFYYRIFLKTSHWFYVTLWTVGSFNAAWLISAWISTIFQCTPVEKAWSEVNGGHCFSQWSWFLGTALPSMIIDLCILVMPLPMLWGLQTSRNRKLLTTGIFVCGYCVIIVSIGRLVAVAKAGSGLEDDLTWSTISYLEWVQCEGPVSVISVCLPTIFNLVKLVRLHGLQRVLKGKLTSVAKVYPPGQSGPAGKFVRMGAYLKDMSTTQNGRSTDAPSVEV